MDVWDRTNSRIVVVWDKGTLEASNFYRRSPMALSLKVIVSREPQHYDEPLKQAGAALKEAFEISSAAFGDWKSVSPCSFSFTRRISGIWLARLEVGPSPLCRRYATGYDLVDLVCRMRVKTMALDAMKRQLRLPGLETGS